MNPLAAGKWRTLRSLPLSTGGWSRVAPLACQQGRRSSGAQAASLRPVDDDDAGPVLAHGRNQDLRQVPNIPIANEIENGMSYFTTGKSGTSHGPGSKKLGRTGGSAEPISRSRLGRPSMEKNTRRNPEPLVKDERYIRRTMNIPTLNDYPDADPQTFRRPKAATKKMCNNNIDLSSQLSQIKNGKSSLHQCILTFTSPCFNETAEGHGVNSNAAEQAAYLAFLAQCHEKRVLDQLMDTQSTLHVANRAQNKKAREKQKENIEDVYNYAARFDAIPELEYRKSSRTGSTSKTELTITVSLPAGDICVTGFGANPQQAEIDAARRFKLEAEKQHAKQGDEVVKIKDFTSLTIDNSLMFKEYLKQVRPGIRIEVDSEGVSQSKGDIFRATTTINGEKVGSEVLLVGKKRAEAISWLTACVEVKKLYAEIWSQFLHALKMGNGQILRNIAPVDLRFDDDCSSAMRDTLYAAKAAGLFEEHKDLAIEQDTSMSSQKWTAPLLSNDATERRSQSLLEKQRLFQSDPRYEALRSTKAELPMVQHTTEVLDVVTKGTFSVVVGATGSGKTTQVPQIILDEAIRDGRGAACNVICTQPRRIAARSVAQRVAQERSELLRESVGYHVRFDAKTPRPGGSINYCTTGILLQQLQHSPDEILGYVSHLIIDEVHERDILQDFLMILLRRNILRRKAKGQKVPQVILMSATMNLELFSNYFGNEIDGKVEPCPTLSVPGRLFPVEHHYLEEIQAGFSGPEQSLVSTDPKSVEYLEEEEKLKLEGYKAQNEGTAGTSQANEGALIDWKTEEKFLEEDETESSEAGIIPVGLIAATISHIARTSQNGSILVFLPGLDEILAVSKLLSSSSLEVALNDESKFRVYNLHSSIQDTQSSVFEPLPDGARKIILSTNIAETSVTIPEVKYIVDSGKKREKRYDPRRRVTALACSWIAKSNAKQRSGRAGRVQEGHYYAVFSKQRHDSFRSAPLPELLNSDLQETCLDIKAQAMPVPVREFLADAVEPPAADKVELSMDNLQRLGALDIYENITPLGRLLSQLPVHPDFGKMIILGIVFRCLDPMILLGAASTGRPLFLNPVGLRDQVRERKLAFGAGTESDQIALLNAVQQMRGQREANGDRAAQGFAFRNFIHYGSFIMLDSVAKEIEQILVSAGLIPVTHERDRQDLRRGNHLLNENSDNVALIKTLHAAGTHPNLAISPNGGILFRTPGERNVMVHPNSINHARAKKSSVPQPGAGPPKLYCYSSLSRTNDGNSLLLRDTSLLTPLQALLFGGQLNRNEARPRVLEKDGWFPCYVQSMDRRAPNVIIEFRRALDQLLSVTFSRLARYTKRKENADGREYLADEEMVRSFAAGVINVLATDRSDLNLK